MKKIKTFIHNDPNWMDENVNEYLAKGYELKEYGLKQINSTTWWLVAILEKDDEEATAEKAKQAFADIRDFCKSVPLDVCDGDHCPLSGWCGNSTYPVPEEWKFPTDKEGADA